jgi:hypothetical protein
MKEVLAIVPRGRRWLWLGYVVFLFTIMLKVKKNSVVKDNSRSIVDKEFNFEWAGGYNSLG